jgi:hypothetical protein
VGYKFDSRDSGVNRNSISLSAREHARSETTCVSGWTYSTCAASAMPQRLPGVLDQRRSVLRPAERREQLGVRRRRRCVAEGSLGDGFAHLLTTMEGAI